MDYKTILLLVLLASSAVAIQIRTEINGVIEGQIEYVDYRNAVYDSPQEFKVALVNTGSVGCLARVRVDVMNGDKLVYSAWSRELPVESGSSELFTSYWQPNESGNYTGDVRIYQCNMIYDGPELNFSAVISNKTAANPFEVKVNNNGDKIMVTVKSNVDLDGVAIIPEDYPLGWIVESSEVNLKKGEERTAEIRYSPGIWKPGDVKLLLSTSDGAYKASSTYRIREGSPYDVKDMLIFALGLACILLAAALVYTHYRRVK